MNKSPFTETQIIAVLKEADAGMKVSDVCRQLGESSDEGFVCKKGW